MKIHPIQLFSLCIGLIASANANELQVKDLSKPNILFILVDDFGTRDLECYGSTLYDTPHMDSLAASGAKFTQAYVAYPRCVPSRFAIFTGKHPAPFQKDRDSVHVEPGRDSTFAHAFQESGYATFYCGKWHLGEGASEPSKLGFDTTVAAGAAGATRSHFAPYDVSRSGGKGEKAAINGLSDAPEGEYLTDRLTQETLKFINQHQNQPFLAVLAYYAVHTPIEAKKHITKKYAEKIKRSPAAEIIFEKEGAGENLLVQNNATYAAMVESVDKGVGRLLKALDRLKIAENTIVILCSDHGGLSSRGGNREMATSNRPFRAGKGHLYEGGLRIPLIVRWPGKTKAGRVIDEPVVTMDLFPTFLEMAGLPLQADEHLDGISFAPLLQEQQQNSQRTFFWHNPAPRPSSTGDQFSSAIRSGNLKLVEFPTLKRIELYDLSNDIQESKNIATERPQDTERLLKLLHSWKKSVGAGNAPRPRKKGQGKRQK